ncbi:MAG TPA: multiheme c-type cytochrome [Desulfatiglandales bacterium]|nr:multiheme c-type cytochrome [Desulfatiglandales bacterium]
MALRLKELGFKNVSCLKGGYREWVGANFPVEKKWTIKAECVTCHTGVTPGIVSDWKASKHAEYEVSCSVCHGEQHMSDADVHKAGRMKPERCAMCHQVQFDQFKGGKHSLAWKSMNAMPTAHRQPVALMDGMKGCGGCHKLGLKTEKESQALREAGAGFGLASCDACHTRHTFTVKEAQQPQACRTCHMGFDHPHWEMYSSSKHGVRYYLKQTGVLPESVVAPTCQTCHMREGNHAVMTGWGFFAVRLPMPQDKKWAEARTTVLKAMGALDPEGKPTPRLETVKALNIVRLTQDDWQKERDKMVKACSTCHSISFARGELEKGDRMIREADLVLAEAILTVADLYKEGILQKPKNYAYPFPDLLSIHDSPTLIEQKLYIMFMEQRMRTFQGAFHANPDYTLWYGWSAMQTSLLEIKTIAEELRKKKT